ncbi:MAG: polyhydroxyalkanoic acid system family protein [Lysobacterales bacterium]
MSTIDIHAYHDLTRDEAQGAAEALSRDLAEKFSIEYGWEGDSIHFQRPGVHGEILVNGQELRIKAYLGFMLMMLKNPIEQEIVRYLTEHFGCRFDDC